MPRSAKLSSSLWLGGAFAAGLVLAAAAPAFAQQTTVEEITVTGRYGPGGEVRSLSQTVSFADLDLTTEGGKDQLRERIKTTAHDLCVRLGEPPHDATPPVPSCEQSAIGSASAGVRSAIAMAKPKAEPAAAPTAVAEAAPPPPPAAEAATTAAVPATATVSMLTNGPVPDTAENRRKYGGPMSRAGKRTAAKGN